MGTTKGKQYRPDPEKFLRSSIIFCSTFLISIAFPIRVSWAAAPNAPSNLVATAVSSSQINLSWKDNSTNETGFSLERATASGGPYSVIKTLGANVTTYSDIGRTQNTTCYYRVQRKYELPIAIDDGPGIKAGKVLGLRFLTAVHFLLRLSSHDKLSPELAQEKLTKLTQMGRYNTRIIEDAMNRLKEGRK